MQTPFGWIPLDHNSKNQEPTDNAILDASAIYDNRDAESQDSGLEHACATEVDIEEQVIDQTEETRPAASPALIMCNMGPQRVIYHPLPGYARTGLPGRGPVGFVFRSGHLAPGHPTRGQFMDILCLRLSQTGQEGVITRQISDTRLVCPLGAVPDQAHDLTRQNGPLFLGIKTSLP